MSRSKRQDRRRLRIWIESLNLRPDEIEEFKQWWAERAATRKGKQ